MFGLITEKKLIKILYEFRENLLDSLTNQEEPQDSLEMTLDDLRERIVKEEDPLKLEAKLNAYRMKRKFLTDENKAEYLREYRERKGLQELSDNTEMQNALSNVDLTNLNSLQNLDPAVIDKLLEKLPKKYQFLKPIINTMAKQFLSNPQLIQSLLSQVGEKVSEAGQKKKVEYIRPKNSGGQDIVDPHEPYPIK